MTERTDRAATERAAYVAGLRKLADLLENHDDIKTPTTGCIPNHFGDTINIFTNRDLDTADRLADLFGRPADADLRNNTMWLTWHLDGLALQVSIPAHLVTESVVTGTVRIGSQVREQVERVLAERFQPALANDDDEGATDA